jgi:hypothetical protein
MLAIHVPTNGFIVNLRSLPLWLGMQRVSGRDPNVVVQELWPEICPIRPCHRLKFGMDLKCPKRRGIPKRLEDGTLQLGNSGAASQMLN